MPTEREDNQGRGSDYTCEPTRKGKGSYKNKKEKKEDKEKNQRLYMSGSRFPSIRGPRSNKVVQQVGKRKSREREKKKKVENGGEEEKFLARERSLSELNSFLFCITCATPHGRVETGEKEFTCE
jgi:hypothetical protein